jgi:DMSO/TMAO reductase YedYZ molybdopterin-dependent catalytic subunit
MNKKSKLFTILIVITFQLTALTSCTPQPSNVTTGTTSSAASSSTRTVDTVSQATLARYRENEIREYQGIRLDPAVGPRDNSISGVQHVDLATYGLKIDGLVEKPVELTYDDVLAMNMAERLITIYCVEGWNASILWRGVQLSEIIGLAIAKPEVNTVIFHCVDGYTTSMPLQTIIENKLILAYQSNGLPLPPEMGFPFIVVAEDKYGYKWARWVNRIELSADSSYEGYWESRGYSNEAGLG